MLKRTRQRAPKTMLTLKPLQTATLKARLSTTTTTTTRSTIPRATSPRRATRRRRPHRTRTTSQLLLLALLPIPSSPAASLADSRPTLGTTASGSTTKTESYLCTTLTRTIPKRSGRSFTQLSSTTTASSRKPPEECRRTSGSRSPPGSARSAGQRCSPPKA